MASGASIKRGKRRRVFAKTANRCWYCGDRANSMDHVVPYKDRYRQKRNPQGLRDVNNESNLIGACKTCNEWKNCLPLPAFRARIMRRFGLDSFRFYGEEFLPLPFNHSSVSIGSRPQALQ